MKMEMKAGIERKPGVCGGSPVIAGTRMTIKQIVTEYIIMNQTPEDIVESHPRLTLAQVHEALAYYYRHQAAIEKEIKDDEEFLKRFAKQNGIPILE